PYGFSASAFYPCYGLAEATLMVTGGKRGAGATILRVDQAALETNRAVIVPDDSRPAASLVSNGRVFPDQELIIIDPESRVPLPERQVGEIWLSGPSVSPGYWNHPDETSETFQNQLPSGGPYLRTGDLGFLHEQECYITGRIKELIIIRGRNLYPQDIEGTIFPCHPALVPNGAAAFSIQAEGEEKLAVVQEINPQKASEIIEAGNLQEIVSAMLQAVTAAYNVQLYAVALVEPGAIPRTISGKIQRRLTGKLYQEGSLKTLYTHTFHPEPSFAPASGEMRLPGPDNLLRSALIALGPEKSRDLLEGFLRGRISHILRVPESAIDPHQPLIALGLDSVTTIELVENIETTIGVTISLAEITQGATLEQLTRQLAGRLSGNSTLPEAAPAGAAAPAATATPVAAAAPKPPEPQASTNQAAVEPPTEDSSLSYGQRALWFVQRLSPEDIAHNLVYAITLHTSLDAAAFRRGIQKLVLRHSALRTRFIEEDGRPLQRVYPDSEHFALTVEDASAWTSAQLDNRLKREVYTPFNIETGPLIRFSLFNRRPQEFTIVLGLHHIIADLWSMAMLGYEIVELYAAEIQQRDPVLKTIRGSYADSVRQETDMLAGPEGEKLLAYWKERLAVADAAGGHPPALVLPTDHPRPPILTGCAASATLDLAPDLVIALKGLADSHNTNLFTILLAAFYTLGFRYTGQT
ncbi:MAG: hypothetical protein EHM21_11165, partial [Chloroflexi bacterium]